MATKTKTKEEDKPEAENEAKAQLPATRGEVKYIPFGEQREIALTMSHVDQWIQVRTKKGLSAAKADIIKFVKMCEAQLLNPWTGDAFLVGFDTEQGPRFQLLVAYKALAKRAEANENYDGIEAGIIVESNGDIISRVGAFPHPGDELVGAWARCHRKDRSHPFEARIKRASYDKRRSRWKDDPEGMLVKVAKAATLREAFPTITGGLYVEEELGAIESTATLVSSAPITDVNQQLEADVPDRKVVSEEEKLTTREEIEKQTEEMKERDFAKDVEYQMAKALTLEAIDEEVEHFNNKRPDDRSAKIVFDLAANRRKTIANE